MAASATAICSGICSRPSWETPLNLTLMRLIDEAFLETPWYGSRQMARHLRRQGYMVGRMRVRRLMARMGLTPIYQKPRTTIPHARTPEASDTLWQFGANFQLHLQKV